jgi:hypothetical protein
MSQDLVFKDKMDALVRSTEPHETRAVAEPPAADTTTESRGDGYRANMFGDAELDERFSGFIVTMNEMLRNQWCEEVDDLEEEIRTKHAEEIHKLQLTIARLEGEIKRMTENQRGPIGPRGERGIRGLAGRQGPKGKAGSDAKAPRLRAWFLEPAKFRITPVFADGKHGAPLDIRPFFVEFQKQTT